MPHIEALALLMRKLSKIILALEATALAYFTFLGLLLSFGAIFSFVMDNQGQFQISAIVSGMIVITALISGWRILVWVLSNGPLKGVSINRSWWVFPCIAVILSLITVLINLLNSEVKTPDGAFLFSLGVYFWLPLVHVIFEVYWQKNANKSLQTTANASAE